MRVFARYKLKRWLALLLSVLLAVEPVAYAQYEGAQYEASATPPPENAPPPQHAFSQQELDQMLAPIALYPDPLLSQILMASTYPLEVVEAARWSRANPNLKGDDAVRAIQDMDWDPSVKSLVAFPQILQMMDDRLDWTEQLGDAFLAQQAQVTDTTQKLRQKAYAAGNLRSNDRIQVTPEAQTIVVEPANPDIVYVPYYDPNVVYGSWWWPDYPPIYWGPWPDYYYAPAYAPSFAWGIGIVLTTGFFFGGFDWHHHRVHVVNTNNYYYHRPEHHVRPGERPGERPGRPNVIAGPGVWHHDPNHRRGVPYREPSLRQQFGRVSASPEAHRDFRGYDQPSIGGRRPERPTTSGGLTVSPDRTGARPGVGGTPERPAVQPRPPVQTMPPVQPRPLSQPSEPPSRPSAPTMPSRPAPEIRPPALEDIGRGSNVRDYSSRGRASQEGAARGQGSVPARQPSGTAPRGGMRPQRGPDR